MIDTVRCYTSEFSLSHNHSLMIPARINAQGEVKECGGAKAIMEGGWACHTEDYHGRKLLFFDGSVPRLVRGTSLLEVTEEDCGKAQRNILEQLHRVGVSLPSDAFDSAVNISRADFCRNLSVSGSVAERIAAVAKFSLPRTDLVQYNAETVRWSNTRREFSLYDKLADVRAKEDSPAVLNLLRSVQGGILRVEYRALRAPVVAELVGGRPVRFAQLFDRRLSCGVLVRTMNRLVRRGEGQRVEGYADLAGMIERGKKKWRYSFGRVVQAVGVRVFMEQFGYDADRLLSFLLQHYPRSSAHRYRNSLLNLSAEFMEQREAALVEEIRQKLAA